MSSTSFSVSHFLPFPKAKSDELVLAKDFNARVEAEYDQ